MSYAIETKKLTKYYGKARGIVDVDLAMEEGEIFGFIGPNGAGKSTTIRTLLGLIKKTSGSAFIFGMDGDKAREVLVRLGGLLETARRWDRAADVWRKLMEVPDLPGDENARAHRRLGRIHASRREFGIAEDVLQQCLQLKATEARRAECLYDLADVQMSMEHFARGADLARQILAMPGADKELKALAGFLLGDALEQQGKTAEALVVFESVRETYPNEMVVDTRIRQLRKGR